MTVSKRLERCPFCGSTEVVVSPNELANCGAEMGIPYVDVHYVHCDSCGADGPGADTEHLAVEAWNTRFASAQPYAYEFVNLETGDDCAMLSDDPEAVAILQHRTSFPTVKITPLYKELIQSEETL